jgi:chromosome partitioning protein
MARKIAFINYKGGVGKTSICVNVAGCLACLGKKVLLIDCDPQSNASIWLMKLNRWNDLNTNRRRSLFAFFLPEGPSLEELIIEDVVEADAGVSILPGLDLIPTTFNLMDLEHDLRQDPNRPFYQVFADKFAGIDQRYDYILFDCPPNVFRMTQCALNVADEVLLPANPDALSLIGLSLFSEKATKFHLSTGRLNQEFPNGTSKITGVILNGIKENTNYEVPLERMAQRLEQLKSEGRVSTRAKIYSTRVHDAIVVRRAVSMGLPVVLLSSPDKPITVRQDYIDLTNEMIESICGG